MTSLSIDNQTYQGLRPYLFSVAYRMTGSAADAEDLVHDAWIRYLDAGSPDVDSLRAYLTTIVSRLSLDYLKSARVQREAYPGNWLPEPVLTSDALDGPAEQAEEREQISLALLTVFEHLSPDQRVVYVLREGFGLPFDDIGRYLDKTPAACRQTFRRARQVLDRHRPSRTPPSPHSGRLLEEFMEAFARGDAAGIAKLLSRDVVWMADGGGMKLSNRRPIHGIDRVSRGLAGLGSKVRPEMQFTAQFIDLNGSPAVAVFDPGGLERVFAIDIRDGRIQAILVLMNPDKLQHLAAALGTSVSTHSQFALPLRRDTRHPTPR